MTKIKADKPVLNFNGNDFIPVACHYDENTLLTKNGQLIQVIRIADVHKLGNQVMGFLNIRDVLRDALKKHVNSNKISIWISTIRETVNLNDDSKYDNRFCQDVYDAWQSANSWNERFMNTLYISIVYMHAKLEVNSFGSFVNSLNSEVVFNFHDQYLGHAVSSLCDVANGILEELKAFKPSKLGVINHQGAYCSELKSFLSKLIYFDKKLLPLDEVDVSISLSPMGYAVGHDKIEIDNEKQNKFISIIGIKEYQEIPAFVLDKFLQLPIGMVVTEILTLIPKKTAIKSMQFTNYILGLGDDKEFKDAAGVGEMVEESEAFAFFHQQINISITADTQEALEKDFVVASKALSDIGMINVKEDIDVEYAFWSRLPGNFHLIKRTSPILKRYTAGFSSLYYFPVGNLQNIWGNAVAILKTPQNTPYYFNFHSNGPGHTCIIGAKGDGKTGVLNFLISMAFKYKPEILYVVDSNEMNAFIEVLGFQILDHTSLPNPLFHLNEQDILEWLRIICGDRSRKLKDYENELLQDIVKYLLQLPEDERLLSSVEKFSFENYKKVDEIKNRLMMFASSGKYKNLLFNNRKNLNKISSVDLTFLTEASFKAANYPKQEKLIPNYLADLDIHTEIRTAVLYILFKVFCQSESDSPKILAMPNLEKLVSVKYFGSEIQEFCNTINSKNGIMLSSISAGSYEIFNNSTFWKAMQSSLATKIVLAGEKLVKDMQSFIGFNNEEMELLMSLPPKGRFFVISQNDFTISAELNLIEYPGIIKILSQGVLELAAYQNIKSQNPGDNLLQKLYEVYKEH